LKHEKLREVPEKRNKKSGICHFGGEMK